MTQKIMSAWKITAASIAASESFTSDALSIGRGENFGIAVTAITGTTPDYTITYTASPTADGTFISPDSNVICANQDTTGIWFFTPMPTGYIKIVITNNSGANAVVPTVIFNMQED